MKENGFMNREERVLVYLHNKLSFLINPKHYAKYAHTKGITVRECEEVLGSTELRKIISTIRKDNRFRVFDIWEDGENKFGEPTRYKRYFIERKEGV